jgi:hypothetical protein
MSSNNYILMMEQQGLSLQYDILKWRPEVCILNKLATTALARVNQALFSVNVYLRPQLYASMKKANVKTDVLSNYCNESLHSKRPIS